MAKTSMPVRSLIAFIGRENCDYFRGNALDRLAGTKDVAISGKPARRLIDITNRRPQCCNLQQIAVVQRAKSNASDLGGRGYARCGGVC